MKTLSGLVLAFAAATALAADTVCTGTAGGKAVSITVTRNGSGQATGLLTTVGGRRVSAYAGEEVVTDVIEEENEDGQPTKFDAYMGSDGEGLALVLVAQGASPAPGIGSVAAGDVKIEEMQMSCRR